MNEYVVLFDIRYIWVKLDWEMFVVVVVKNEIKEMFIDKLVEWVGKIMINRVMMDLFDLIMGDYLLGGLMFVVRLVMGGMFVLLVLLKE